MCGKILILTGGSAVLYVYLVLLFFGSGTKPFIKNIGNGEGFSQLSNICQNGTRSHMQMLVKLLSFGDYKVTLLKEWRFGKMKKTDKEVYSFKVDGKKVTVSGIPYFNGMYTYSPTFLAISKKGVKWGYVSSDSCDREYNLVYPGKGFYLLKLGASQHVKPCNMMSINSQNVELAPLFETSKGFLFLMRVEDTAQDSIRVVVAREGKLQKSRFIKSGELYLGVMDNAHYDVQVGDLDINFPEALRLLGQ